MKPSPVNSALPETGKVLNKKNEHKPLETGGVTQATEQQQIKSDDISLMSVKKQQNQMILKSGLELSVSSGNQPLELLYKTAIEGINQVLEEQLGKNTIQESLESGLDVTPEATADRIVSLSTGFYSQYKDQNPQMSDAEAIDSFTSIIKTGIDTGYSEARTILENMGVLENEIASNIDLTYQLVHQGLQKFVDATSLPASDK